MIEKVRKRIGSPRVYSEGLKQKVLNAIIRKGIAASEAAQRFGVKNESSVRNWINQYNKKILVLQYRKCAGGGGLWVLLCGFALRF